MATDPTGPFSRLFRDALVKTISKHTTRMGLDQLGWLEDADAEFQKANRLNLRVLNAQAVAERKRQEQRNLIRNSRHPAIEAHKELARIAKLAVRHIRIEQIEIEPGQYVAKRNIDCSRRELLLLAAQYERQGKGMFRRAAFYRTVEQQLGLAGIDEASSLADWIAQQDEETGS